VVPIGNQIRAFFQRRQGVLDSTTELARGQKRMIVLGVTDCDSVVV
jgi:hypothetical protein